MKKSDNPENMPKSYKERKLKYIANLKRNGTYDDYKKRRGEQEKDRRLRKKGALAKLTDFKRNLLMEENRFKTRKRVQKFRITKREGSLMLAAENKTGNRPEKSQAQVTATINFSHSYKTQSAIRKAYAKTNKTLPSSPSKKKLIIAKFVNLYKGEERQDVIGARTSERKKRDTGLSSTLVSAIQLFYERDDISRISPNVKDARNFLNPVTGEKELKQIRHLMFKLSEVYGKFVEESRNKNGNASNDHSVKLSKFCSLRPQHVYLVGETPRSVCFCIYHSNFSQCCTALHKYIPALPKDYSEMVKLIVCENASRDCYFKSCKNCTSKLIDKKIKVISNYSVNKTRPVEWMQWKKDEKANRHQNEKEKSTKKKLIDYFLSIYSDFLKHSYIMHEQSDNFNVDRETVDLEENFHVALLQMDFAENFKCESQDEIQTANYNQKQISLFTNALRHAKKLHSKVITSDNTQHIKETIVAYLYKIFVKFPPTIKILKIWSDGPRPQFKNKFIAAIIHLFEKMFNVKIFWNFFATAHGKSCVDGIGAAVKKKVKTQVLSRQKIVNKTNDFLDVFRTDQSKVEVFELTSEEIEEIIDLFSKASDVIGISKFHQLQFTNGRIKGYVTSKDGYDNFRA